VCLCANGSERHCWGKTDVACVLEASGVVVKNIDEWEGETQRGEIGGCIGAFVADIVLDGVLQHERKVRRRDREACVGVRQRFEVRGQQ